MFQSCVSRVRSRDASRSAGPKPVCGQSAGTAKRGHLISLLVTLLVQALAMTMAQASWEFRVCADPYDYPASSRERGGFLNDIAQILAEEMRANVTYEWTLLNDVTIENTLLAGSCDAVIGIGENVAGVSNTVPFLRVPYVFVTRTEDGPTVASLDDPGLRDLTIGTYAAGIPALALRQRGLETNLRTYAPVSGLGGPDLHTPILDALVRGEIDVAVVFGLAAVARAESEPVPLTIVPVTPEVDAGPNLLQHFRLFTIGVRPNDVVFRERLNQALAARWEDVQMAIQSRGVPTLDVVQPSALPEEGENVVSVGVVAPTRAQLLTPIETVGEAARLGAELARNLIATDSETDVNFRILTASAPTLEATRRAADRLAVTEGVVALVGGFDFGEASVLAEVAKERGLVFFNVGANEDVLRASLCDHPVFHVEASQSMYAEAVLSHHAGSGASRWYTIHAASANAGLLEERLASLVEELGGASLVGMGVVEPSQLVFTGLFGDLQDAGADALLVFLPAMDAYLLASQLNSRLADLVFAQVPTLLGQSREYLVQLRDAAPLAARTVRPALWEATLETDVAGELNARFQSRTGQPMDPAAWATYAAIAFVYNAAERGAAANAASLVAYLEDPANLAEVDVGKGSGLWFRMGDRQLVQPLYLVQIEEEAAWGNTLSQRLSIARSVGQYDIVGGQHQAMDSTSAACRP